MAEVGVNPFGPSLADELFARKREESRLTATEVRRRVAEQMLAELREQKVAAEMERERLLELVDAPVPFRGMTRFTSVYELPFVYFVQAERGGPVKIGHAVDYALRRRLSSLQVGNPDRLVVRRLVHGGELLEKILHDELSELRLRGEWFRDEGQVAEIVRPDGELRVLMWAC